MKTFVVEKFEPDVNVTNVSTTAVTDSESTRRSRGMHAHMHSTMQIRVQ